MRRSDARRDQLAVSRFQKPLSTVVDRAASRRLIFVALARAGTSPLPATRRPREAARLSGRSERAEEARGDAKGRAKKDARARSDGVRGARVARRRARVDRGQRRAVRRRRERGPGRFRRVGNGRNRLVAVRAPRRWTTRAAATSGDANVVIKPKKERAKVDPNAVLQVPAEPDPQLLHHRAHRPRQVHAGGHAAADDEDRRRRATWRRSCSTPWTSSASAGSPSSSTPRA